MSYSTFSLSYDAEDENFNHHIMSAKDYGNAVSEMSVLIKEAVKQLKIKVDGDINDLLQVKTPARAGSIIIDFILSTSVEDVLVLIGFSPIVASVHGSVIETLSSMKGKEITKIEENKNNPEIVTIHTDTDTFEVSSDVSSLIINSKFRNALHNIIKKPLENKKNAIFKVKNQDGNNISIPESKIDNFNTLPDKMLHRVDTSTESVLIKFVQVNFESFDGWKILHDGKILKVEIDDSQFMSMIASKKEVFVKDMLYSAILETKTHKFGAKRSKFEYSLFDIKKNQSK